MDKYQPGVWVVLKAASPIYSNSVIQLISYIGNNTWIVLAPDLEKVRINQKWFHDVTKRPY